MTLSAAATRGVAHPVKVRRWNWHATCPTCDWRGPQQTYKGAASEDARRHNEERHP